MTAEELAKRVILSVRAGAPFDEIVGMLQPVVRDTEKYDALISQAIAGIRNNDKGTRND